MCPRLICLEWRKGSNIGHNAFFLVDSSFILWQFTIVCCKDVSVLLSYWWGLIGLGNICVAMVTVVSCLLLNIFGHWFKWTNKNLRLMSSILTKLIKWKNKKKILVMFMCIHFVCKTWIKVNEKQGKS